MNTFEGTDYMDGSGQPESGLIANAALQTIANAAFQAWRRLKPNAPEAEFVGDLVEHMPTEDPTELSRQLARLTCTQPMLTVANAVFQLAKDHGLTDVALMPIGEVFSYYGIEDCFELVRSSFVAVELQEDDHTSRVLEELSDTSDTLPVDPPDEECDTATGWAAPDDDLPEDDPEPVDEIDDMT